MCLSPNGLQVQTRCQNVQILPAAVVGVSYSKSSVIPSGTSKCPNTYNYCRCAFTPNALSVLAVGQNVLFLPRTVVDVSYCERPTVPSVFSTQIFSLSGGTSNNPNGG